MCVLHAYETRNYNSTGAKYFYGGWHLPEYLSVDNLFLFMLLLTLLTLGLTNRKRTLHGVVWSIKIIRNTSFKTS